MFFYIVEDPYRVGIRIILVDPDRHLKRTDPDPSRIRFIMPDPDQARHPGRADPDPCRIRIILPDPDRFSGTYQSTTLTKSINLCGLACYECKF